MCTGIGVLSEHFPAFARTAPLPHPCSYLGSSYVLQCDSEPLATVDGPGMDTLGQLFLPWESGTRTKGALPFNGTITFFHSCCRSYFQPRDPDTEVPIKKGK